MGGYGAIALRRPRRPRAGDLSIGEDMSAPDFSDASDESAGLDLSGGTPDFSDVTGGSSTFFDPSTIMGAGLPSLGGIGSAIQQFMGGGSSGGGSAAAAGIASTLAPKVAKHVKKVLRHIAGGGRSGRRMNPGNFKALRRSMRRLQAFQHAARKVYQFTHPARGKSHFKFHRKRRR
jgi:hypothetical protein